MLTREQNYSGPSPLLYLVATPIGNLEEFTERAKKICQEADFIAAEDTRNSFSLLKKFNIEKPFISCHEHNEEKASEKIISLLKEGKKVAYMSDAGYPAISDPGSRLAKKALENGVKVAVINGPSAGLCALVGSGLPSDHFYFYGFLDARDSQRKKELAALKNFPETIIFYESPHRIMKMLADVRDSFGENRDAVLCRELTKAHEEYIRGTLGELALLSEDTLLGEMVLVIEGQKSPQKALKDADIVKELAQELKSLSPKEAIAKVSTVNSLSKNKVYELYLSNFKK